MTGTTPGGYRGRFAPSPTGPLHFGSLLAALASWLDARARSGEWLVRIEDLDPPRVVPGAADSILAALDRFGLSWDGPVLRQSERTGAYREAAATLHREDWIYPCRCSRREIADSALPGLEGPVYPGTCRARHGGLELAEAFRLRTAAAVVSFVDRIQGPVSHVLEKAVGDFVVRRADGVHAYQLAVVVDDAWQGITDIVRGADLLVSTTRQVYLQQRLRLPTPRYAHVPVAISATGEKLSKQTGAAALDPAGVRRDLLLALRWLGHAPPADLGDRDEVLAWAVANWQPERIPRQVHRRLSRPEYATTGA